MRQSIAVLFCPLLIFTGCREKNTYYPIDKINIEKHERSAEGVILFYHVPLETMFYSSGCDAEYSADSSEANLQFIRQRINTTFTGNLPSRMDSLHYTITFPKKVKQVSLDNTLIITVN